MQAKDLLKNEHYLALIKAMKSHGVKFQEIDAQYLNEAAADFLGIFEKATGENAEYVASVLKNEHDDLLRYFMHYNKTNVEGKFVTFLVPLNLFQFVVLKHFPDKLADYISPFSEEANLEENMQFARELYENASRSELAMPVAVASKPASAQDEQTLQQAEATAAMPEPDFSGMSQKELAEAYRNMSNHALVPQLTEGLTAGLEFYKTLSESGKAQDTNVSVELDTDSGLMSLHWGEEGDGEPFFRHHIGVTLKTCAAMLRASEGNFRHSLSNWFEDAVPEIHKDLLDGMEITLWVPETGGDPYLELL